MNRHCGGSFFKAEGLVYYRCLLDGTIMLAEWAASPTVCPHCERPVQPWGGGRIAECQVETVKMVVFPDDWHWEPQPLPG